MVGERIVREAGERERRMWEERRRGDEEIVRVQVGIWRERRRWMEEAWRSGEGGSEDGEDGEEGGEEEDVDVEMGMEGKSGGPSRRRAGRF